MPPIYFSDSDADGRQDSSEVCRVSGKVDAVRLPKQIYYAHRVMQNEQPDLHILGHWNYPLEQPATPEEPAYRAACGSGRPPFPDQPAIQAQPAQKDGETILRGLRTPSRWKLILKRQVARRELRSLRTVTSSTSPMWAFVPGTLKAVAEMAAKS